MQLEKKVAGVLIRQFLDLGVFVRPESWTSKTGPTRSSNWVGNSPAKIQRKFTHLHDTPPKSGYMKTSCLCVNIYIYYNGF